MKLVFERAFICFCFPISFISILDKAFNGDMLPYGRRKEEHERAASS